MKNGREVPGLAPEGARAVADARDVEQIVDEPRHLRRLPLDHRSRPLPRARPARALDLERSRDRGERIAKLVAQDSQEVVLAPRRLGELALPLPQCMLDAL